MGIIVNEVFFSATVEPYAIGVGVTDRSAAGFRRGRAQCEVTQVEARGHPTDRNPVAETVRHYRSTAVYLVVAVTVILGLALWEEVFDPPPPYCGPQAADIEGEHA